MSRILITGGAKGLGYALARIYVERQDEVTILDLQDAPEIAVENIRFNVATDEAANLNFDKPFDVIICNAGISVSGDFKHIDFEDEMHVMQTNYLGHSRLIKYLFCHDLVADEARLAFISSATQYLSFPIALGYAASKSALDGFAHALESYGIEQKISVTRVYPGPMNTEHKKYYPGAQTEGGRMPEQSAPKIVRAIDQRKRKCTPDPMSTMYRVLSRIIPRTLARKTHSFYKDRLK